MRIFLLLVAIIVIAVVARQWREWHKWRGRQEGFVFISLPTVINPAPAPSPN
jgi:hypothetical protein